MSIAFDMRVNLDDERRQVLKEDLSHLLARELGADDSPHTVVISRPTADPGDQRILAEITSESGIFLGSIVAEADGGGQLLFTPPGY